MVTVAVSSANHSKSPRLMWILEPVLCQIRPTRSRGAPEPPPPQSSSEGGASRRVVSPSVSPLPISSLWFVTFSR